MSNKHFKWPYIGLINVPPMKIETYSLNRVTIELNVIRKHVRQSLVYWDTTVVNFGMQTDFSRRPGPDRCGRGGVAWP